MFIETAVEIIYMTQRSNNHDIETKNLYVAWFVSLTVTETTNAA